MFRKNDRFVDQPPHPHPIRKKKKVYLLFENNRIRKHVKNFKNTHHLPCRRHKCMVPSPKPYLSSLEAYSENSQTSTVEFFASIAND